MIGADPRLLDLRLPKLSGVEVMRELQRRHQVVPTLLITTFDDDVALLEGVRAGARGYLLEDVTLEYLANAIRTVAAGATLLQPALTERPTRELQSGEASNPKEDLTARETEILRFLSGGFSNREIADALQVAEGTVKNHVSAILGQLAVRDRTRAVLKAIQQGLLGAETCSAMHEQTPSPLRERVGVRLLLPRPRAGERWGEGSYSLARVRERVGVRAAP